MKGKGNFWSRRMKRIFLIILVLFVCPSTASGEQLVTVFGPKQFTRMAGQPNFFQETFTAAGEAELQLFNGGEDTATRVTSARLVLNGKQILNPADFKKKHPFYKAPITLEGENSLKLTLESKPGSFVLLRIVQSVPFEEGDPTCTKADLGVTNLVLDPDRCNPGDPVTLRATVTNWGRRPSGPATLIFTVDGNEVRRFPLDRLGTKASISFSANWPAQGSGRHTVKALVESGPATMDPVLNNNARLATLRVSGEAQPVPELLAGPPTFDPWPPVVGQPATLNVSFRNPSFLELQNVWLYFYMDGRPLGINQDGPSFTIPTLGPGMSTQIRVPWSNVTGGQHTFKVELTNLPENFPAEQMMINFNLLVPAPTIYRLSESIEEDRWRSLGPYQMGVLSEGGAPWAGKIMCLAVHPQDPRIIYAGGGNYLEGISGCGIWKTMNGGQTWKPVGDNLPNMNIHALAIDPRNPEYIYAADGGGWSPADIRSGFGKIYKSLDGGNIWNIFTDVADGFSRLAVCYDQDNRMVIYAASNQGLFRYRSDDPKEPTSQMTDWERLNDGHITDLAVHPTNCNLIYYVKYLGNGDLDGLYQVDLSQSTNHVKILDLNVLGSNRDSGRYQMAVDLFRNDPRRVHAVISLFKSGKGNLWFYSSNAGGGSFSLDYQIPEAPYDLRFLRAHPEVRNFLYLGGVMEMPDLMTVRKSVWGWGWYHYRIPDIHADQQDLVFFPEQGSTNDWSFVLANDGGINRIDYPELQELPAMMEVTTNLNNGLVAGEFLDFDVAFNDPLGRVMLGSFQDNGTQLYISDSDPPHKWKRTIIGDGTYCAIAPTNSQYMYAIGTTGKIEDMLRSTNEGNNFSSPKLEGFSKAYEGPFGPIVVDQMANKIIYVGRNMNQLQRTLDGGDTWSALGDPLEAAYGKIHRLVSRYSLLYPVVVGTTTGRVVLYDLGGGKHLLGAHPLSLEVSCLAVSPNNPNILYVAYDGANADFNRRLQRFVYSPEEGWKAQWISINLPIFHANGDPNADPSHIRLLSMAAHPTNDNVVFLGTDKGVFRGEDTLTWLGWHWQHYNLDLPWVKVTKLVPHWNGEVFAATEGRGVFVVNPKP